MLTKRAIYIAQCANADQIAGHLGSLAGLEEVVLLFGPDA